jgi:two-component system, NtrC family, sensor kinase
MNRRIPFRFLTVLLAVVSVALVVLGAINFQQKRIYQLPTDGVTWVETQHGLRAWKVDANSPGARAGIQEGDYLVSINGHPVRRTADAVREIFESGVWSRATYNLERDGETFPAEVIIVPQSRSRSIRDFLELVGLLYLIIGAFVFLRRWSARKSLHFYVFCLTSFVLYAFSYTGKLNLFDSTIYWLDVLALVLQPALFLHFCLTFPEPRPWVKDRRYAIPLLYLPGAALFALHALVMAGVIVLPLPDMSVRWLLDGFEMALLAGYFAAGALVLLRSYRQANVPLVKQQLKWVTRGTFVAVGPFVVLYAIPYFLGLGFTAPWMKFSVFSLILLPLTFGYAIVRYRLMDVDVIFRRGAAYALATAAIVGLYFGLVVLFADFFRDTELIRSRGGWLLAIIVTALLFQPMVNWIQLRLERFFNRERYDYRATLLQFARDLTTEVHVEGLLDQTAQRLGDTLAVDRVAIFLAGADGKLQLAKSRGIAVEGALDLSFLDAERPEMAKGYLFLDSTRSLFGYPAASAKAIEQLGLHYYFPLTVKGRTLGFLGLGKTHRGDFLSSDDVDLLRTISGYVSVALENARLYESLEREALEYQALKDFSESIIESIDVGVLACDLAQKVESWNLSMEKLYGLPGDQAVGKSLGEIFPPELLAELPAPGEPRRVLSLYKFRLANALGEPMIVNLSTVPLLGKGEEVIGRLLILTDLTEKVNLEDQLVQAEKLSSIGMLAAGVAHEVNTPLAVITSQVQMLLRQTAPDDPNLKVLDKVVKQGFRASEIINNLLKFSRVSGSERTEQDVNRILRDTHSLVEPILRSSHIAVSLQLARDLPPVFGNAGKLQQVFMNLIMNARDAMPQGGELTLVSESENSSVLVEVADNGVGIPPEHLRKIFDPFFTTKSTSRGTGLGLAVAYGIIREHSGKIDVQSAVGRGTTFRLELPAARKPVHAV